MFICFQQPENIFIDKATNKVQIGDFGLAKLGFNSETEMSCFTVATAGVNICNLSNASIYFDLFCLFVFSHPVAHSATRGVGTHSYAAPEQLNNSESDAKV